MGGNYQIRTAILNDRSTWRNSRWIPISDEAHYLELDWHAATAAGRYNGGMAFWIDGRLSALQILVDNDTRRIERVRLGAVVGIDASTNGTYYLDAFESRHNTSIGPASAALMIEGDMAAVDPATLTAYFDVDEQEPEEAALLQEVLEQAEQETDQGLFMPFVRR
jgi:hypothetical protein